MMKKFIFFLFFTYTFFSFTSDLSDIEERPSSPTSSTSSYSSVSSELNENTSEEGTGNDESFKRMLNSLDERIARAKSKLISLKEFLTESGKKKKTQFHEPEYQKVLRFLMQ